MEKYNYEGPVMEFDRCVSTKWKGTTYAASEQKARNNLAYQFKKQNNRGASTRITLPGKIMVV